jgi:hypothetical protein
MNDLIDGTRVEDLFEGGTSTPPVDRGVRQRIGSFSNPTLFQK